MHTAEAGLYHRARATAQSFTQTAALIYETYLNESPRREPLVVVPFIVNASFACELFLKAIAYRAGYCLGGHNLSELLSELPIKERQRLDDVWTAATHSLDNEATVTFESAISELSNSFVDWRYAHEKERVKTASSTSIFLVLKVLDDASKPA